MMQLLFYLRLFSRWISGCISVCGCVCGGSSDSDTGIPNQLTLHLWFDNARLLLNINKANPKKIPASYIACAGRFNESTLSMLFLGDLPLSTIGKCRIKFENDYFAARIFVTNLMYLNLPARNRQIWWHYRITTVLPTSITSPFT